MSAPRFNVFGHIYEPRRESGAWRALAVGNDGKLGPAGFEVPSIFWRAVRAAFAISLLALAAHGLAAASDGQKLADAFRRQFTNRNPALTEIQILASQPLAPKKRSSSHVYVVHAIRPDHRFEGRFDDEQFGIFLVDPNRERVVKVLDMFSTPRWLDYDLKITRASISKVTVSGAGASYGDGPITRTYNIGRKQ